jgi:organic hydroperoxide reductase OsmC/OhrA
MKTHQYNLTVDWTGNRGVGTKDYTAYGRDFEISIAGKPTWKCSSDPAFRGDAEKYNPEEMLVASLSSCHMLWYLHLCADHKIVVEAYRDSPAGVMTENSNGGGRFIEVVLRPEVTVFGRNEQLACDLHRLAHEKCFIANSVNFPVRVEPKIIVLE